MLNQYRTVGTQSEKLREKRKLMKTKLTLFATVFAALLYWTSCSGDGGLEGVYTHDGGVGTLSINFRNDGTCIYQIEVLGVTKDFDGTYSVSGSEVTVKHDGAKSEQVYKMTGDGALIGSGGGRFEKR